MEKSKNLVSKLIFNKFFLQLITAVFIIGMAVFFIRHEHVELLDIRAQLARSNPWYVAMGVVLTGIYVLAQAQMYVHSFQSIGRKVPFVVALRLFLKRNLIGVFLPAGGFSSLAFFTGELEDVGVTKSQAYLASTLFGFASILSVGVVAIPVLGFVLLMHRIDQAGLPAFGFLLLLIVCTSLFLYSAAQKGKAYRWLARIRPRMAIVLDEMIAQEINWRQAALVLLSSMLIEIIGIIHLYLAMLALGVEASWPAAIVGYVVMVVMLVASPFLRGLGAIEVSLTFVLGQFGLPILAAVSTTLLFRFLEFWLPLLAGIFSFISRKDNLVVRILPVVIIFILGILNIISAITPAIPARLRLIQDLIPEDIIVTSNGLVLVFGFLLVILSVFLLQGSKRAWYIGICLTSLSVLGHLLKAADYEEAFFAFAALASLLYTRSLYKLKPHPRLTRISYLVLLYSVFALLSFGVLSFYLLDKRHFGIDFEWWFSIKTVFRLFFLFDDTGLQPQTAFARDFLYAIYAAGGMVLGFIFFSLLRPYTGKPFNSDADRQLAKDLVEKYGRSALDYFKVYPDKLFFLDSNRDGFVAFKLTRRFAFVLELPVCKDAEASARLIRNFEDFCDENGFTSVYYRVPKHSLDTFKKLGKRSIPIGEEAIVDLSTYTIEGGKMKPIRNAINRLTADGHHINIYDPPIKEGLLQKLEQVSDDWLEALHQKEIAFTQGIFDRTILKNQTIITLEDKEERVYAFLNLVPDYVPGEATYDLIRKTADAPNGVLDMLLAKTLLYFRDRGYRSANIGLAPLSGIEGANLTEKGIRYVYDNLKTFGHFKGLRKYKEKFFPAWEQRYLIYSNSYDLLQIPGALKSVSVGR